MPIKYVFEKSSQANQFQVERVSRVDVSTETANGALWNGHERIV